MTQLLVRQVRGVAGRPWQQRLVLKGLGLSGPGSEVVVQNERAMRGMIRKVLHLVSVEEVAAAAAAKPKAPAAKTAASAPKKGKS
jgi:large subunit ribosomal protein L30